MSYFNKAVTDVFFEGVKIIYHLVRKHESIIFDLSMAALKQSMCKINIRVSSMKLNLTEREFQFPIMLNFTYFQIRYVS